MAQLPGCPAERGHRALASLGVPVITQNVDGLHQAAGSQRVLDLHGRIDRATCLECGLVLTRASLQEVLSALNPEVVGRSPAGTAELRPDGDADVAIPEGFNVPKCPRCRGVLKPDVVFFGESVPPSRVATAFEWLDEAEALLVLGSSLTVRSGLRLRAGPCGRQAGGDRQQGRTRADEIAT